MAEPYDILASLNRMLESEERREQTKLQSSLALMQFAQQKRLQDIQLAGQQLELLQAANSQMMGAQSEAFLTESGLESLYLSTFEEDEPAESAALMTRKLTKGDWKLTPEEANRIVGAVYASKAGNHQGILKIGSDLNSAIELGNMSTSSQQSLFNKFAKAAPSISEDRLSSLNKTIQNQNQIVQEMFEFGQGDYDISPDISMQDIEQSSSEEIDDSLSRISEDTDDSSPSMLDGMTLKDSIKGFDKQIKELNIEIKGQREDISNIDNQKRMIQSKQLSGISISESEQNFLDRSRELKALGEAEMKNLNNQIQEISQEQQKFRKAKSMNTALQFSAYGQQSMFQN